MCILGDKKELAIASIQYASYMIVYTMCTGHIIIILQHPFLAYKLYKYYIYIDICIHAISCS